MPKIYLFFQNSRNRQWFIFAIACLIYSNTIPNKWAIDDSVVIYQNRFVKRGIAGIDSIFTTDAFTGFYGRDVNAVSGGRYRPLTPALFALQASILAPAQEDTMQHVEKDKAGYKLKDLSEGTMFPNILHFFNMLWYGVLCLVLYRTLLLLLQFKYAADSFKVNFIATVAALLYSVHPIHTDAVANVKGLDEILALLGALMSLYAVLKVFELKDTGDGGQKTKWLFVAVGSYFLALLAKESAVTFIAVIPLALWFFTQASFKTIIKLTAPLLIPVMVFLGIRTAVLYQPDKHPIQEELMNDPFLVLNPKAQYAPLIPGSDIKKIVNPGAGTYTKMPYSKQLATNFYTYGVYLKLLIAPYPLTVDYYPRHIRIKSISDLTVILSLLIHGFLLAWALFNIRKKRLLVFGILYYFITFSIVSNLFFPIGTNMAERFMFMPSVGFCLVISCLLYTLGNKLSRDNTNKGFSKIYVLLTGIVLVFSGLTFSRNFYWKDNFTLFSHDILVSKNSGKINTDLAACYIDKAIALKKEELKKVSPGSSEQEQKDLLERSIPMLNKALEIHPLNGTAWLKMANANHFLGQMESNDIRNRLNYLQIAVSAYQEAYMYRPAGMDTTINNFKALCFMDLGKLWGQKLGNIPVAVAYLEEANLLSPKEPEIYLLLGTAYSMLNNYEKAIEYTKKSLELRPNDRDTKQNLAVVYQSYAFNDASKKELLPIAENILTDVYNEEKKLAGNNVNKKSSLLRTLDLLYKNAVIQKNKEKQEMYKTEVLKLDPNPEYRLKTN